MQEFAKRRGLYFLADFDIDVLESFQGEWTFGDVTALKTLERLKGFFRAATVRKWIVENPALTLRGPKPKPHPTLPFTGDEMRRILAAIEKYPNKSRQIGQPNALRLCAFVLILRYTGMRISDAVALSTDRLVGAKILLYTPKDRHARVLRIAAIRCRPSGLSSKVKRALFFLDRKVHDAYGHGNLAENVAISV